MQFEHLLSRVMPIWRLGERRSKVFGVIIRRDNRNGPQISRLVGTVALDMNGACRTWNEDAVPN
jgi:hypothetical protein